VCIAVHNFTLLLPLYEQLLILYQKKGLIIKGFWAFYICKYTQDARFASSFTIAPGRGRWSVIMVGAAVPLVVDSTI
jgi:hypothetical protein